MKKLITIFFCFSIINNLFASELDKVQKFIDMNKYDKALDLLKDLSDEGDINAHKIIASIYVSGGGYVDQNISLAIFYLNRAVDAKDSSAALTLLNIINDHGGSILLKDIKRISKITSLEFKKETEKIIERIKTKNLIIISKQNTDEESDSYDEKENQNTDKVDDIEEKKNLDNGRPGWKVIETNWGVIDNYDYIKNKLTGGYGTGFFINKDGYIITNHHVIEDCEKALIYPNVSTESALADIIKQDKSIDLALLKTNKSSPMYLSMSGKKPPLGTEIVVGGFPTAMNLGIGIKITKGIVSGSDTRYEFLDIIDAAIQQGSSGGPVINQSGNLIGVVVGTQLDQEGNSEQTLNFIVNWKSLKKFLKNSYINYRVDSYTKNLSTTKLASQLERTAVTIMCVGK